MAAADTKTANNQTAESKPGAGHDHATDKKVAANTIADPHKLHAEAWSKPAATPKPAPAKPADTQAHSAAPAKPHEHQAGLWGWISGAEKNAEDAWASAKKYVKSEVKAAVSSVDAALSPAHKAEPAKSEAPKPEGIKPEAAKAEAAKAEAAKAEAAKAEAATKQDVTKPAANPAVSAEAPKPGAPAASPADAVANVESTAGWIFNKAVDYAKTSLSSLVGSPTEQSLLIAAAALPAVAPIAAPVATAAVESASYTALPELVGYAGVAVDTFKHNFSDVKTYAKVAEHVDSIDNLPSFTDAFAKSESQSSIDKDKIFAHESAKAAFGWLHAGDNKPGGNTSLVSKDGHIIAKGASQDGTEVQATSTPERQTAKAGDVTAIHNANGTTSMDGKDWEVTKDGDRLIARLKGTERYSVFDLKTKTVSVYDDSTHESHRFTKDGVISSFGPDGKLLQTTDANAAAKKDGVDAHAVKYFIDAKGNMAAISADGVRYNLYAQENRMEILKDNKLMKLDLATGHVQLYTVDAVTKALTIVHADAAHLPKGWQVMPDGSVNINGQRVAGPGTNTVAIGAATYDRDTKTLKAQPGADSPTVTATGTTTVLTNPASGEQTTVGPNSMNITSHGKVVAQLTRDPVTGDITMPGTHGENLIFSTTKNTATLEEPNHQRTTLDEKGNVRSVDSQNRELFTMNNKGDIHLYDNTTIDHTGAVYNPSRNISEAASATIKGEPASEFVKNAAARAESLAAMGEVPGGLDASIASLESILSALNSLGDCPELADQIGAAKATVQGKLDAALAKESLNAQLTSMGKDNATIERAFELRAAGNTDGQIVAQLSQPQAPASDLVG